MKTYGLATSAEPRRSGPTRQAADGVRPRAQVCAEPKSPFMPEPSAPTNTATTNAMTATRSAYCTVETPCSEYARSSTAPCALRMAKKARMSNSVTTTPLSHPGLLYDYVLHLASDGK
jgi:hypothetical protein